MVENLGLPDYAGELTALRFYRITIIIIRANPVHKYKQLFRK